MAGSLGGMLFGAFPVFYGIVLSSLYMPIFIMLFGLIFRGVSFEFRGLSEKKRLWGYCFGIGSLIAAKGQGFAIGTVFYGLQIVDGKFTGTIWDWANPFSGLTTAGLIFGYTALGANFLIIKTNDVLQETSYRIAAFSMMLMILAGAGVVLWLNYQHEYVAQKWRICPRLWRLSPL